MQQLSVEGRPGQPVALAESLWGSPPAVAVGQGLLLVAATRRAGPRVHPRESSYPALRTKLSHQAIEFLLPDNPAPVPRCMDHSNLPRG